MEMRPAKINGVMKAVQSVKNGVKGLTKSGKD